MKKLVIVSALALVVSVPTTVLYFNSSTSKPQTASVETASEAFSESDKEYIYPFSQEAKAKSTAFCLYDELYGNVFALSSDHPEVYAISSGEVVESGFDQDDGYYFVVSDINSNFVRYGHLASEADLPPVGTNVDRGDIVSKAGLSGSVVTEEDEVFIKILITEGSIDGKGIDLIKLTDYRPL